MAETIFSHDPWVAPALARCHGMLFFYGLGWWDLGHAPSAVHQSYTTPANIFTADQLFMRLPKLREELDQGETVKYGTWILLLLQDLVKNKVIRSGVLSNLFLVAGSKPFRRPESSAVWC
jgi:hypothetical protein